jgi:hypothetical protein
MFDDGDRCDKPVFGRQDYCVEHYNEVILGEDVPEEQGAPSYALDSIPPTVNSLEQVRDVMGIMIPQLIWGNVNPKLMTALTSACLAQAKIIELTDIESKLKELEALTDTDVRYSLILDD